MGKKDYFLALPVPYHNYKLKVPVLSYGYLFSYGYIFFPLSITYGPQVYLKTTSCRLRTTKTKFHCCNYNVFSPVLLKSRLAQIRRKTIRTCSLSVKMEIRDE